jgi:hypothetical protein
MGVAVQAKAAGGRSRGSFGEPSGSPSIDPWTAECADDRAGPTGRCPEIDCVRSLLAADVIDATERRAAALGVDADRVLIAASELDEEIYLRALGRLLHLPGRQCAGRAGASAVHGCADLFGGERRPTVGGDNTTVAVLAAVYGRRWLSVN